ncbi:MAG: hypothetical protein Q4G71_05565 [Pseudomonadota bacterium]|nr:hypothetical protein [Pseudomonadota bacterium]
MSHHQHTFRPLRPAPLTLAALACLGLAQPAWAVNECGVVPAGVNDPVITCNASTYNTTNRIVYNNGGAITQGLMLILNYPGRNITSNAALHAFVINLNNNSSHNLLLRGTDFGTISTVVNAPGNNSANGMLANYGGTGASGNVAAEMNAARGTITTQGNSAHGVSAATLGTGTATATMTAGTVTTAGETAFGLRAQIGPGNNPTSTSLAQVNMQGGSVTTGGLNAYGIHAQSYSPGALNTVARITGGSITTNGFGGHAVHALAAQADNQTALLAEMTGGTIRTTNGSARGLLARNDGQGTATAIVDGAAATITTSGADGSGVAAFVRGSAAVASSELALAELRNGTITVSGVGALGVDARHERLGPATARMTGGTVNVNGTSGAGVSAQNDSTPAAGSPAGTASAELNAGQVNATQGGHGVQALNTGGGAAAVTVSGGSVQVASGNAVHTATLAGQMSTIALSSTVARSASGNAIFNNEGDSTTTVAAGVDIAGDVRLGDGSDRLTFNGTDLASVGVLDGGDDTSDGDGWIDVLTLNGVTAAKPGSALQNWEQIALDATTTLTLTDASPLAVGTLTNAGTLTATQALTITGTLGNSGTVNAPLGGTVTGNVANTGTLDVRAPGNAPGNTLTITGDLTGGGEVQLNVVLDDGATPAADRIVVQGADAAVTLVLHNQGGVGALTTGNGIPVATLPAGATPTLAGDTAAGGFTYALHEDGGTWFLRSTGGSGGGVGQVAAVPVAGLPGLGLMALLLAGAGALRLRRQK